MLEELDDVEMPNFDDDEEEDVIIDYDNEIHILFKCTCTYLYVI